MSKKAVIDFMNWLTDMDLGWWPLLRLRPSMDQDIDSIVVLKLTPFFGTVCGVLVGSIIAIDSPELRSPMLFIAAFIYGCLTFFILYRFTFALAWNSRARTLRQRLIEQGATSEDISSDVTDT